MSFTYQRTIAVSAATATLAGFPVLVKATLDPAHVATGFDFRFEQGGTGVPHHIESYDSGSLVAWVLLDLSTSTTSVDLFYGDASVTTDQSDPSSVWASFVGVWFLNEASGTFTDWAAGHDMSAVGSQLTYAVPGPITTALARNGSTAELSRAITTDSVTVPAGALTVMAWGKSNSDSQNSNAQLIWEETSGRFRYFTTGGVGRNWRVYKTSGTLASLTGTTADQSWHHLALRVGTDGATCYQDGAQINTNATVNSYIGTSNKVAVLSSGTASQGMNGAISHLMIATADLGADWVSTAFANQSDPATFAAVGSEETSGPTTVTATSAQTLPALTQAAAGTRTVPPVSAAAAQALPALAQAATGSVPQVAYWSEPVTVTVGGTGVTGTASQALPALAQEATGTTVPPAFAAAAAQSLPALTQGSAGASTVPDFAATTTQALPSLEQTATATRSVPDFPASAVQALPSFTQQAAGTTAVPAFTAATAQTLPSITQAAVGAVTAPSTSAGTAQTLPALTQQATGARTVPGWTGTAAQTLPAFGQEATATATAPVFEAATVQELPALTQAASGAVAEPQPGTTVQTLPSLTQAAAGETTVPEWTAEAAQTLPALTQQARIVHVPPGSHGPAVQSLPSLTQTAAGTVTLPVRHADAVQSLPSLTQVAAGTRAVPIYIAAAAQTLAALTQAAAGVAFDQHAFVDITVTGTLAARRWTAELDARAVTATLPAQDRGGTLAPRRWAADLPDRRWTGDLT